MDVIKGSRLITNGLDIEYISPTIVNEEIEVVIKEHDVAYELIFWGNALIMCVVRGELTMTVVKKFMKNVWNFIVMPKLFYNDEGYFIIKRKYKEDKRMC